MDKNSKTPLSEQDVVLIDYVFLIACNRWTASLQKVCAVMTVDETLIVHSVQENTVRFVVSNDKLQLFTGIVRTSCGLDY